MSVPAQITINPDRDLYGTKFPSSDKRLAGERLKFGNSIDTADARFFGEDGAGISDIVDAINPLRHIPFVSSLYEEATGTKTSAVSKLVGGTLLGGPVGFIAALGNIIFEQETGHTVGGAMLAALSGETIAAPTQLAAAPADAVETPIAEILPPQAEAEQVVTILQSSQQQMAAASAIGQPAAAGGADADTLSLFGANAASAHASYRKAQFTPYLKDVGTSLVM